MILASAQTQPNPRDIRQNLDQHYQLVERAAKEGAELIVFPEMSLTGYEREKASDLSFSLIDPRLDKLRSLADKHRIIIIAGAPVKINEKLHIGSLIIKPNSATSLYTKQHLHNGEEQFFSPSAEYNPLINLQNEKISFAICADIDHSIHPKKAKKVLSSIYIPSIFFSKSGISDAHSKLSNYAKKHSLSILMSNFSGTSNGIQSGGRSAFWNAQGDLVKQLDENADGLLVVKKENDSWLGSIMTN